MKKNLIFILIVILAAAIGIIWSANKAQPSEKMYVALEGESAIAVVDSAKLTVLKKIDLAVDHQGGRLPYAPHNVQVSPDMKSVWATANAGTHQNHTSFLATRAYAHGDEPAGEDLDEVVVIDPLKDEIIGRIPIGKNLHLAHVVLSNDSAFAYATAQTTGEVYRIDARTYEVVEKIELPEESGPHGLRVAPNGDIYIAGAGAITLIEHGSGGSPVRFPLEGVGVQAGITPNGRYVVASIYDEKKLAVLDASAEDKKIAYISLPSESKGPVQMYATPDSKYFYLADQGWYFEQPIGEGVYKIDIETRRVEKSIKAGEGPHGVVVSPDGNFVYVTNLLSDDVSVISTLVDMEVSRIKVGKEPNGISVWSKALGGTP